MRLYPGIQRHWQVSWDHEYKLLHLCSQCACAWALQAQEYQLRIWRFFFLLYTANETITEKNTWLFLVLQFKKHSVKVSNVQKTINERSVVWKTCHTAKLKKLHLLSLLKRTLRDSLIMACVYLCEKQISHSQLFNLTEKKKKKHNEIQQLEAEARQI